MKKEWLILLVISAMPTTTLAWVMYSMADQEEVRNIAKGIALVGLIGNLFGFACGWVAGFRKGSGGAEPVVRITP